MHSLARPSRRRHMHLTGCPSLQGTISSISPFKPLTHGGSGINAFVYTSSFLSSSSSSDVSDEADNDKDDESELVCRLVAFSWQ